MRTLSRDEINMLKHALHGALDGRNGTVCSPAQPEKYAMLRRLLDDGYMTGGHTNAMTGDMEYFYVSDAGKELIEC